MFVYNAFSSLLFWNCSDKVLTLDNHGIILALICKVRVKDIICTTLSLYVIDFIPWNWYVNSKIKWKICKYFFLHFSVVDKSSNPEELTREGWPSFMLVVLVGAVLTITLIAAAVVIAAKANNRNGRRRPPPPTTQQVPSKFSFLKGKFCHIKWD